MVAINATAPSALAVLQRAQTKPQIETGLKPLQAEVFDPTPKVRFGPGVADAILNVSEQAKPTKLSDLPPEHAEYLRRFGVDAAIRWQPPVVSDEEFQSLVMNFIKENWGNSDRLDLREALTSSTLKIQRASDVEGLRAETIQYDLFKDGHIFGGAGWGTINMEFYNAQAAAGVRQSTGSINGLDYYITW
ncbi:hypothetical protein [Phyllobacterium phragmitis]|uniref:ABC transporter substrate-binding protein n=1 Tax=Phyllobacterium phragmitis TaxID=2670329 RepID=A0ABQ0H156_9HYPH